MELSAELDCRDRYANGAFRLPDEKEADANRSFETGNISSLHILPQQEEIIEAVRSTPAISVPSTHPQEPTQSLDENQVSKLCPLALYFVSRFVQLQYL